MASVHSALKALGMHSFGKSPNLSLIAPNQTFKHFDNSKQKNFSICNDFLVCYLIVENRW